MLDLEQVIRERAYQLWAENGRNDGQAETHWLIAQREILGSSLGELGRVIIGEPAAKPKKSKSSRKKQLAA